MTNLEKLEEAIYKELPRLKEIKVGQRLFKYNTTFKVIRKHKDGCILLNNISENTENLGNNYIETFDILGREIALNDVLEFLEIKHSIKDYFIDTCGQLQRNVERIEITWDLSKPLLKEQSEELINYLTELI